MRIPSKDQSPQSHHGHNTQLPMLSAPNQLPSTMPVSSHPAGRSTGQVVAFIISGGGFAGAAVLTVITLMLWATSRASAQPQLFVRDLHRYIAASVLSFLISVALARIARPVTGAGLSRAGSAGS
jgi:hypothetical protein